MSNFALEAGTVHVVVSGTKRKLSVIDFNMTDQIYNLCNAFSFTLPATLEYFIPPIEGTEIKVYLDGSYYYGGYFKKFNETDTTFTYECVGYGYQIAVSELTSPDYANKKGTINDFISSTINNSFSNVEKISVRENVEFVEGQTNVANNDIGNKDLKDFRIGAYSVKEYTKKDIIKTYTVTNTRETSKYNFLVYDPYNLGTVSLESFLLDLPKDEKSSTIINYLNNVIRNDNLYLKCLGRLDDLTNIDQSKLIKPTRLNSTYFELSDGKTIGKQEITNISVETFVILLWKPNDKPYQETRFAKLSTVQDNIMQRTYLDIDNTNTKNQANSDAYSALGFNVYNEVKKQIKTETKNNVVSSIPTLIYNSQGENTGVLSKPKRNIDNSEIYDSYIVVGVDPSDKESSKPLTTKLDNPSMSDGTTKVVNIGKLPTGSTPERVAAFEINQKITHSFKIDVEVVGFKQGLTINDVNYGKDRSKMNFWGVNQQIRLVSPVQGIDALFLISEVKVSYNGSSGATTHLTLVHPNAFSYLFYDTIEMNRKFLLAARQGETQ